MNDKKTKKELLEAIDDLKKQVEALERYKQYEGMANEISAMHAAFKNSGFDDSQAFALVMKMIESAAVIAKPYH